MSEKLLLPRREFVKLEWNDLLSILKGNDFRIQSMNYDVTVQSPFDGIVLTRDQLKEILAGVRDPEWTPGMVKPILEDMFKDRG